MTPMTTLCGIFEEIFKPLLKIQAEAGDGGEGAASSSTQNSPLLPPPSLAHPPVLPATQLHIRKSFDFINQLRRRSRRINDDDYTLAEECPMIYGPFLQTDASILGGYVELITYICKEGVKVFQNTKTVALYREICLLVTKDFLGFQDLCANLHKWIAEDGYITTYPELRNAVCSAVAYLEKLNRHLCDELTWLDRNYQLLIETGLLLPNGVDVIGNNLTAEPFIWIGDKSVIWCSNVTSLTNLLDSVQTNAEELCFRLLILFSNQHSSQDVLTRMQSWKGLIVEFLKVETKNVDEALTALDTRIALDESHRLEKIKRIRAMFSPKTRLLNETKSLQDFLAGFTLHISNMESSAKDSSDETNEYLKSQEFREFMLDFSAKVPDLNAYLQRYEIVIRSLHKTASEGRTQSQSALSLEFQAQAQPESAPLPVPAPDTNGNELPQDLPNGNGHERHQDENGEVFSTVPESQGNVGGERDRDDESERSDEFFEGRGGSGLGANEDLDADADADPFNVNDASRLSFECVLSELKGKLSERKESMRDRERTAYRKKHGEKANFTDDEGEDVDTQPEQEQAQAQEPKAGPSNKTSSTNNNGIGGNATSTNGNTSFQSFQSFQATKAEASAHGERVRNFGGLSAEILTSPNFNMDLHEDVAGEDGLHHHPLAAGINMELKGELEKAFMNLASVSSAFGCAQSYELDLDASDISDDELVFDDDE